MQKPQQTDTSVELGQTERSAHPCWPTESRRSADLAGDAPATTTTSIEVKRRTKNGEGSQKEKTKKGEPGITTADGPRTAKLEDLGTRTEKLGDLFAQTRTAMSELQIFTSPDSSDLHGSGPERVQIDASA